jgi:hypothetical protein
VQSHTTTGSNQLEEKQTHTMEEEMQHSVAWSSRRGLSDGSDLGEVRKNLEY